MNEDKYSLPSVVINELVRFISKKYPKDLTNSLLIAQEFILTYPEYGREYGLSKINEAIEDVINQGLL